MLQERAGSLDARKRHADLNLEEAEAEACLEAERRESERMGAESRQGYARRGPYGLTPPEHNIRRNTKEDRVEMSEQTHQHHPGAATARETPQEASPPNKDLPPTQQHLSRDCNTGSSVLNAKPRSKGWPRTFNLVGAFRKASSKGESSKTPKPSTLQISRPYLQSSSSAFETGNENSSVHHEQSNTTHANQDDTSDFLENTTILGEAALKLPLLPQRLKLLPRNNPNHQSSRKLSHSFPTAIKPQPINSA